MRQQVKRAFLYDWIKDKLEKAYMSVVIPDEILQASGLSERELIQEIAIMLFQKEKLTLGQASNLAQMPQLQFQQLLASRRIPIHYDIPEFEADLNTLKELGRL